jgi:hypothetical protein
MIAIGLVFVLCDCAHVASRNFNDELPQSFAFRRNGQSFGPTSRSPATISAPIRPTQLERMNQEFTAAVERAFRVGGESEMAATATYDLRRR